MNSLIRPEAVARILGISKMCVYNLARAGAIRSVTFKASGDRFTYRFREEDLAAFVESHLRQEGKGEVR